MALWVTLFLIGFVMAVVSISSLIAHRGDKARIGKWRDILVMSCIVIALAFVGVKFR